MMKRTLQLLPIPREISFEDSAYQPVGDGLILLDGGDPQAIRFSALRLQAAIQKNLGLQWELAASAAVPPEDIRVTLRLVAGNIPQYQWYHLKIDESGIRVESYDAAGIFYGVCTLVQILEQAGEGLPCLDIRDWPDYQVRGVMLDISRDKVYRMETLYELIDRLASWKVNQLQFYTEHTYAYRNHPDIWQDASPMTGEQILALDEFCRERFIELVPNQNSFGHMHRFFKHVRYAPLAETYGKFQTPWGSMRGPFSLAPDNPGSFALIQSMYDELLPHFSSRTFNVGCDETLDLGAGQSKEICAQRGAGQVYLDFLLRINADLKRRGFSMQFWGDIIHSYPELVKELPRDMTALLWGYEADHPFDEQGAQFGASGIPFYVCPGTSAWRSLAGRTDNALGNLLNAAENGLKHGAIGYLNTDWGDAGHWQVLPVSFLGFAAGAAYSWCPKTNRSEDMAQLTSRFAFDDPGGVAGQLAYQLGNIYRTVGRQVENGSLLFGILQKPLGEVCSYVEGVDAQSFTHTLEAIEESAYLQESERMARPDADLIRREYANTVRLMQHACRRGLLAIGDESVQRAQMREDMNEILEEYRWIWLQRNRPGGLEDSTRRFEAMLEEYS
ncbi:MAG: family 20 glycosylhydrolase [Anaerolineaceae bacterium]|nr:family 20 glycosylhydrolase [Anaerolineaceae bacterium]